MVFAITMRHAGKFVGDPRWVSQDCGRAVQVVLTGAPNVGKSSAFNALVGRDGAIVSHRPGTTRDYLTATLDMGAPSAN